MKKNQKRISHRIIPAVIAAALCMPTMLPDTNLLSTQISDTMMQTMEVSAASYTYTYYPKCKSSYTSLVDALKSVGVSDTSLSFRKSIAVLNGYSNYTGTAAQNTALLNLLKNGKLVKSKTVVTASYLSKCGSGYTSIVDALNSIGVDSSYAHRKALADANGISNYSGTAAQNTSLLNLLKNGKLKVCSSSCTKCKKNVSPPNDDTPSSVKGNTYNKNGNVSVSNKAKENNPYYRNTGARSAAAYNQVINQFNVASNSRYKKDSRSTYCNIFAWDVMQAMNTNFPHWLKNNAPASSTTSGAYEINANATYNWLKNYGSKYGWTTVSAANAQNRANAGYPTIAIWYNSSGGSGHVMVVRPKGNGYVYSSAKGPVIAQAGASNFNYGNVSTGMGSSKMSQVVYYTHN